MPVAIDHVYDLQHNTDTVFNKLQEYYKDGYQWIKDALDDKANVKSYFDLLGKSSSVVKRLAPPVLYNKLGEAKYKEKIKTTGPSGLDIEPTENTQKTDNSYVHNPDNIPETKIPAGYRLLDKDEIVGGPKLTEIQSWTGYSWKVGNYGDSECVTYITKLSRQELKDKREGKTPTPNPVVSSSVHNVYNLTPEVIEVNKGYRLLDEDEIVGNGEGYPPLIDIEMWNNTVEKWDQSGYRGDTISADYRTKLSKEELKNKRHLNMKS